MGLEVRRQGGNWDLECEGAPTWSFDLGPEPFVAAPCLLASRPGRGQEQVAPRPEIAGS